MSDPSKKHILICKPVYDSSSLLRVYRRSNKTFWKIKKNPTKSPTFLKDIVPSKYYYLTSNGIHPHENIKQSEENKTSIFNGR